MDINQDMLGYLTKQIDVHAALIRAMAQKLAELQLAVGQLYMLQNQKEHDTVDVVGSSIILGV